MSVSLELDKNKFEELDKKIKYHITSVKKSYVFIGRYLTELKPYCVDIKEFALVQYGFKKSTTYNMMRIYSEFGQLEMNEYSYTQLVDMLSMSLEQREKINPDMSVREIRKIKKDSNQLEKVKPVKIELKESNDQYDKYEKCRLELCHEAEEEKKEYPDVYVGLIKALNILDRYFTKD